MATAQLKIEVHTERLLEQTAEIDRLKAALNESEQRRVAAEQQTAVAAALKAAADHPPR